MAKVSTNSIPSLSEDWGRDPRNGLPYSGQAVQEFIKSGLRQAAGAAWFDQATFTLHFFRTAEDRDAFAADPARTDLVLSSTPLNFSSDMYRIALASGTGSWEVNAATNQASVVLSVSFAVQTKTISDSVWNATGDGANVRVYIDAGAYGSYTEVASAATHLNAGEDFGLDVRSLLATGQNRVKVVFTSDADDSVTMAATFSVTLSEMYIETMGNTWYNAVIEGDATNYRLGGFKVVGALSKTLHLEIYSGNAMVLSFDPLIGVASYVDTPYNFTPDEGLDLSALPTGVYICKAYLTSGSLTSLPVSYSFMHVAEADRLTARLVCVNDVAPTVYNYSTAALCSYALYNAGLSTGDPHILIQLWSGNTPTTKVDADYPGTTTGEPHTLDYTIEWLVEETINLQVYANITLGESSQVMNIPIDNSATYPAESGADFYLNATSRSNNDADREKILNEAASPAAEIAATWERMAWVDGIDGWTTDPEGRKCLLVPAGSRCRIPYQVMAGENMTFELCYRAGNTSDYGENVITVAEDPTAPGFQGIRIRPTGFTIHSGADIDASKDTLRGKSVEDETTVHLLATIQNSFGGNAGRNLVTAYVNGCKALQFDYANGTAWENAADLVIGSDTADTYIYFCRVYRKVLGVKSAEQNFINSLRTLEEREAAAAWFNSVRDANTNDISYEKVVNAPQGYNYFVMEMKDGAAVPSRANGWSKDTVGYSDFEMHYGKHPGWDYKLFYVPTGGQGTTSMDYYRWNIRLRIDKADGKQVLVAYYDAPTTGLDGKKVFNIREAAMSKTVFFDGGANGSTQQHPAVMRITAKANVASSMQSHKIGATRAYNDLQAALGIRNEAQAYAEANGLPVPVTAVYQYPAFGFVRTVSAMGVETYEFIGLFTIGPDKGDKPTFGFDLPGIKENLISLEGTDHARRMAVFQYPWNDQVEYRASNECLNIVKGNNDFDNGWEVGNCHGLSTDSAADQSAVQEALETEFKPAYKVAWDNSTLIFPVALGDPDWGADTAAGVLARINAAADTFRGLSYSERFGHADMEFWIEGEYTLYHYDIVSGKYVAGIDLVTQNGTPEGETPEEQNEWFKAQRRARFLEKAPSYWDIQDACYHFGFCVIKGATDNFGKNSYPYKMARLAAGGRWKWRQDDLDTTLDTDNRGSDSKPYYIEFKDSEGGSVVFAGATSVFWNLMYEVFWDNYGTNDGIESIGRKTVQAMASIGGGSNPFTGVVNFFRKYFWDNAQNYFPPSAYNVDASFKYEAAWLANGQAVDPLSQSLGRHLEAERLWCTRRAIYVMSLFKVGPFASYSDTSLGQVTFRPQSLASLTLTPTMWMYPAIEQGQGSPEATGRTEAGESRTFTGPFGNLGQTNLYIQATDYMRSLGDWKDLVLAAQFIDAITVVGAKLREFKIGDEVAETVVTPAVYYTEEEIAAAEEGDDAYGKTTEDVKTPAVTVPNVTTNVPGLVFSNTRCLEEIDARNAASLTGALDLSVCTRLLRAWFEGTSLTQVALPNGSKAVSLHLPDTTNAVILRNHKFLADLVLPGDLSGIRTLQVENCANQDAFAILRGCYGSEDAALQYIRIVWAGIAAATADDVHMLANIAAGLKKDGETEAAYRGINAQGNIEGNPVIEGTVQLDKGVYADDFEPLEVTRTEDYGDGLKRALSSVFGTLSIIYDPQRIYINFADPEVRRIAVAKWGDGEGVTVDAAAAVTGLSLYFRNNTEIATFNELRYFYNLATIYGTTAYQGQGAFQGCTALTDINLPQTLTSIGAYAFQGCTALTDINLPEAITSIGEKSFNLCFNLESEVDLPNLTTLGAAAFASCTKLREVKSLGSVKTIPGYCFNYCYNAGKITLPSTVTSLGEYCFQRCAYTDPFILDMSAVTIPPTRTGSGHFNGWEQKGEVVIPEESVRKYHVATGWTYMFYKFCPQSGRDIHAVVKDVWLLANSTNPCTAEKEGFCLTGAIPYNGLHKLTFYLGFDVKDSDVGGSGKGIIAYATATNNKPSTTIWNSPNTADADTGGAPRTVANADPEVAYVFASVRLSKLSDAYLYDETDGVYLWKGSEVTKIYE